MRPLAWLAVLCLGALWFALPASDSAGVAVSPVRNNGRAKRRGNCTNPSFSLGTPCGACDSSARAIDKLTRIPNDTATSNVLGFIEPPQDNLIRVRSLP